MIGRWKNDTEEEEPEKITRMKKEMSEISERERIQRISIATDGGVRRGKDERQITAGLVLKVGTEEGNEHTYTTG